ncbi:uncharacterized protein TNCV_3918071 [Trichonephila clavipes]|nr:uncharacterized protein TNCV_3918071 [Trichonephila clavipes]
MSWIPGDILTEMDCAYRSVLLGTFRSKRQGTDLEEFLFFFCERKVHPSPRLVRECMLVRIGREKGWQRNVPPETDDLSRTTDSVLTMLNTDILFLKHSLCSQNVVLQITEFKEKKRQNQSNLSEKNLAPHFDFHAEPDWSRLPSGQVTDSWLVCHEFKPGKTENPPCRGGRCMLNLSSSTTRGLLATDHVILNHGQVTWTTPELAPPLLTTTPHQREDVSALDRFNVHRCPTRRVLSGTGIELMTCLPWLDTLTTGLPQPVIPPDTSLYVLAIHQNDHQARRRFVEWAQNEIAVVPDFHKRILFSDEAHFWLNGYVNKQNCRIWSEANPQVYVETPLHPEKLTVWCALWAGGIIGPYFFKNDEGHNVTVTGHRYRAMITNFFIPELNNHDVQELWFQQDGATCHTARATIDLLKDTFGDRLISRFGPVNWPPRSCDLTPLDYFLWGYVKSLVYADKPQTLDHLEDIIRRVIADIRPQMLGKVIENWTSRLDYIRASRDNHMPEIIFKM